MWQSDSFWDNHRSSFCISFFLHSLEIFSFKFKLHKDRFYVKIINSLIIKKTSKVNQEIRVTILLFCKFLHIKLFSWNLLKQKLKNKNEELIMSRILNSILLLPFHLKKDLKCSFKKWLSSNKVQTHLYFCCFAKKFFFLSKYFCIPSNNRHCTSCLGALFNFLCRGQYYIYKFSL